MNFYSFFLLIISELFYSFFRPPAGGNSPVWIALRRWGKV